MIAAKIREKENMLISCVRDQDTENSDDIRMQIQVSDTYIDYIKALTNFICVCQLLSIRLVDLVGYSKTLTVTELFTILQKIDHLIETMFKMFEERNFCKKYRIFQNHIFLLFIDFGKTYQCYYILFTTLLDHVERMDLVDCKRTYCAYSNFVRISKEVRRVSSCVVNMFSAQQQMVISLDFYDTDPQMYMHLMTIITEKSKQRRRSGNEVEPFNDKISSNNSPKDMVSKSQHRNKLAKSDP